MLPPFLSPTHILSANDLVTIWQAIDTRTGAAALFYRAAAPAATALVLAQGVLGELHEASTDPIPTVIDGGEDATGNRWLALGLPKGSPLREQVLSLTPLTEFELLSVVRQQLKVLSAVHRAGYCGLRPTPADLWWDDASNQLVVAGWEWLAKGNEDMLGDLRAAAATWIELATCAPPGTELRMTSGPESWLALSTGTRRLFLLLWQDRGPDSAKLALEQADALHNMWQEDAGKLLEQGQLTLKDDPVHALTLLDIARRRSSDPEEVDRAYLTAKGLAHGQAASLIIQGQRDFEIGQYTAARRTFQRVSALPHVSSEELIMAARWAVVAQALADAVKNNLSDYGFSIREMESHLSLVMEFVAGESLSAAREQLEIVLQKIPTSIQTPSLRSLEKDLRAQQLWQKGLVLEEQGRYPKALNSYQGAMENLERIATPSYPLQRMEALVKPSLVRCKKIAAQREYVVQRLREGEKALAKNDYVLAARAFLQAAAKAAPWPDDRVRYLALGLKVQLWADMNRYPIISSEEPWDHVWMSRATSALTAIQTLLEHYPEENENELVQAVRMRWCKALLRRDATDGGLALDALSLLNQCGESEKEVRALSSKIIREQLNQCNQFLDDLAVTTPRREDEHREAVKRLNNIENLLNQLKRYATKSEQAKLQACQDELLIRHQHFEENLTLIRSLRVQYEHCLQMDVSPRAVLEEAAEKRLELFDAPLPEVSRLLQIDAASLLHTRQFLKNLLLQLAGHALATEHHEIAADIYGISWEEMTIQDLYENLIHWGKLLARDKSVDDTNFS